MTIKNLILAAAATAITATAGAADTYFENGRTLEAGNILELGLITAEGAGVVEIYDYHRGEQGRLLGTDRLFSGANTNVRVNTRFPTNKDVIAVVKVDGQVVAQKHFDVD